MNISGKHKAAFITCAIFSTLFFILSVIKISTHLSIDKPKLYYELEALNEVIEEEFKKPISSSSQSKKMNQSKDTGRSSFLLQSNDCRITFWNMT